YAGCLDDTADARRTGVARALRCFGYVDRRVAPVVHKPEEQLRDGFTVLPQLVAQELDFGRVLFAVDDDAPRVADVVLDVRGSDGCWLRTVGLVVNGSGQVHPARPDAIQLRRFGAVRSPD